MPLSKLKAAAKKRVAAAAAKRSAAMLKGDHNTNMDHNYGKTADRGDVNDDPSMPPPPKKSKTELSVPKRILECPVCLEVPRGKIFVCEETHPVCEPCYVRMEQAKDRAMECPVAKCPFPKDRKRLWLAEQLVEESGYEFDCKYTSHGCDASLVAKDILAHEDICRYREMFCFVKDCTQRVSRFKLTTHFKEKHSDLITKTSCPSHHYDKSNSVVEANTSMYAFWNTRQMTLAVGNDTVPVYSFSAYNKDHAVFGLKADLDDPLLKDRVCKISVDMPDYATIQYEGKLHDLEDSWPMLLDEKQLGLSVPMNVIKRLTVDGKINIYTKFSLV